MERAVLAVIGQVAERFGPPRSIGVASMAESGFLVDGPREQVTLRPVNLLYLEKLVVGANASGTNHELGCLARHLAFGEVDL